MKSRFSEFAFMLFAGMDGANGIAGSADAIVLLRSPITKKPQTARVTFSSTHDTSYLRAMKRV